MASCSLVGPSATLSDAQQVIADAGLGPSELKIAASVDHRDQHYDSGGKIMLSLVVTKAAYVAVLRVLRNGETTLVFPNKSQPNALVAADTRVQIPASGDAAAIIAGAAGLELFEFAASTDGSSWLFKKKPEGDAAFADLGSTTRPLAKDVVSSLGSHRGAETAATHLTVRIAGE